MTFYAGETKMGLEVSKIPLVTSKVVSEHTERMRLTASTDSDTAPVVYFNFFVNDKDSCGSL